jgi:hypothetical protein
MFLETRKKNMHGLGVGISMAFEIFRALPVTGWMGPPRLVMTYIPSDVP